MQDVLRDILTVQRQMLEVLTWVFEAIEDLRQQPTDDEADEPREPSHVAH